MTTVYFILQCIAWAAAIFAGLVSLVWFASGFITTLLRKK